MAGDLIRVRLTGAAKIGQRWLKAGPEDVTADELEVLRAEGLVGEPEPAEAGGIELVAPETGVIEAAAELEAERLGRKEAEAERDALQGRVADLEAQLALATSRHEAAGENAPPSATPAKTTPKKGAAASPA